MRSRTGMRGRGAGSGERSGSKEPCHTPSRLSSATGTPQLPAAGTGLPLRGAGVSPGRERPRMEWNGSWTTLAGRGMARLVRWT